jgi:hypothetical protein
MADSKNIWSPSPDSDDESFFVAPLGTTLPTDAIDVLDAAFEGVGVCGEEGLRNNITRNTTQHRNWGGRVVHSSQDEYDESVQITFLENNPIVKETVFGAANVDVDFTSGHRKMTVRHDDAELPRQCYVARAVEGVKTLMYVVPEGQVTEVDEIQLTHSQMWQITVTIYCYKPATGSLPDNPAAVNEYTDEPDVEDGS